MDIKIIDAEWEEVIDHPLPRKKRVVKFPWMILAYIGLWLISSELLSRWLYGFGLWR